MIQCLSCTADSELYLCTLCIVELRANLTALFEGPYVLAVGGKTATGGNWHIERRTPGLLANLTDVVVRQTRISTGSGHRKRGDEMPGLYEPDTEKGRRTKQGEADTLLHAARNSLTTIAREMCETRGVLVPKVDTEAVARWLAANVHSLACDDAAGQWKAEIDGLVRKAWKVMDRSEPPQFCGPCTHYVEHNQHCGRLLYAKRDAIEITCRTCKTTHNIEYLTRNLSNRIRHMRFTSSEILMIMDCLRTPLRQRSWERWCSEGRVKVRGWKRPDNPDGTRGAIGPHRRSDADKKVYRLSEVQAVQMKAIKHGDALVSATT